MLFLPCLNYDTINTDKITLFHAKHDFFKKKFLSTVIEWNKLDPTFKNTASPWLSKKNLSKFVIPSPNSVFNCYNCKGIKHLVRLCPGLSHLNEHKLKHSFQDILHPFCSCDLNVETNNTYVFISYPLFNNQRCTLFSTVSDTYSSMTNTSDLILTHILLFGKALLDISINNLILKAAMNHIISTNRFDESLFSIW